MSSVKTWDIFCRVVDNYGDIGVCWRLARQLSSEFSFQVRLWVDDIKALHHMWPQTLAADQQFVDLIEVRLWPSVFPDVEPADVVIEAFACSLPEAYLAAMKRRALAPHWFNLEYLSAESWVEGCHGLASVHPQLGLKKTFFFPGFSLKTGGLLKEASLLATRDAFLDDAVQKIHFLQELGITYSANELIISLFGYENPAIACLINAWTQSPVPVLCLVPEGKILVSINNHLGKTIKVGEQFSQGSLRLSVIPFLTQTRYDQLLWVCDINFVRGEDSFVRAQWAGKPFVWHIYPQDDDVHMIKLDAFLALYLDGAEPRLHYSVTQLWHQWNRGLDCGHNWNECLETLQNWQKHTNNWCQHLDSQGDLTSNIVGRCF